MTRDVNRAIEHVERVMARALDESGTKPPKKETPKTKSPTIRTWRAPANDHSQYPEPKARSVFREKIDVTKLAVTARAIKVTIPLDPAAVGALPLPNQERVELIVSCDGQQYATSISAKSLRKTKNVISANGASAVFVMLQGKLKGHEIVEGGITAQVKVVKAAQGIGLAT
jgi:ribosomal protein L28